MNLDAPTLHMLTNVAGASLLTGLITEMIKRAWDPMDPKRQERWMPIMSVFVGVAIVLFATFALGLTNTLDLASAIVTGIFAGFAASGMYATVRGGQRIAQEQIK